MIVREFKLRPTVKQRKTFDLALWQMISVYNTALNKLFVGLSAGKTPSRFDLTNCFSGHGKKCGLNQDAIVGTSTRAHRAFDRWISKDSAGKRRGKPRKKSQRNKIRSITYGVSSKITEPRDRRIRIPGMGKVRCSAGILPFGPIKGGMLVRKSSGYYFQYIIDTTHAQAVSCEPKSIGIDPGFSTLLTLSDGAKFENPRELRKTAARLAQSQRGRNKSLTARIHERLKRQRLDRNHKISHEIVKNYSEIYASDDSLRGLAARFGKSVTEAGLGDLLRMIAYKSQSCGRRFVLVNSKNTTRTCSVCLSLTGPTGLDGLGVRTWDCSCGASHDRDINAARVILRSGQSMPSGEKTNRICA